MNELTRQCLLLSNAQKARLISNLKASMEEEPQNDGSRFAILYKAASDIVGKGILTSARMRELIIGRMMIVYQMRLDGFTLQTIARHLVKNHASVYHLQKKMEDVLKYPQCFPNEMKMWNEFQEKIKEYEVQD